MNLKILHDRKKVNHTKANESLQCLNNIGFVSDGIEMTGEVKYTIPLGIVSWLANDMFAERRVNAIFDHRFNALEGVVQE